MKSRKEDFTSIVSLLIKSGHQGHLLNLTKESRGPLKSNNDYVWFPTLQIIADVDNNFVHQIRRDPDTSNWYVRSNRKKDWHKLSSNSEFIKLIEINYEKHISNIMTGE